MSEQSSKVAIVTDASRGIGAAVAERLAKDGFTVVINYSGDAAPAEALARKIEAAGGHALAAKADISVPDDVRRLFQFAETAFGGVDVLVNNAGIMKLSKIADSDDDLFASQVAVNLKGTFSALREAARRLRDGGRIVNVSTSVVGTKFETYGVYAATKAAVETLTAILSKELRGRSITVNAVAPGPTATALFFVGKPQELIDRFANRGARLIGGDRTRSTSVLTAAKRWEPKRQTADSQAGAGRAAAKRPVILPVGFLDRQIIDASETSLHQAGRVELPVLVAIGAEPVAAIVVPLIGKAHGDPVLRKGPQLFDQPVVKFL